MNEVYVLKQFVKWSSTQDLSVSEKEVLSYLGYGEWSQVVIKVGDQKKWIHVKHRESELDAWFYRESFRVLRLYKKTKEKSKRKKA